MSNFTRSNPGSYLQIRNIHTKAIAVPNKVYYGYGSDGTLRTYRGTHERRLKEETQLVNAETDISNNTTDIEKNEQKIIDHENRVTNLEAIKADKCFAIAMSIIL